jgi:hypothetical protein
VAVRVPLELKGPEGDALLAAAVLNGGFEVPDPHLLLPARCAALLLGDYRSTAAREALEAAGGEVELLHAAKRVTGRVVTRDRAGHAVEFRVFVSDADTEVLVSDAGIDALGIRVESFVPGRWRFADETRTRDTEAPQYW